MSRYRKLGEFIRQIDERNSDLKVKHLLGVSVEKRFIESIANTIGTDFSKYKIVKKGQFTYIPDTSRRGDKIAIALLSDYNEGLVSNIYTVFEVTDKTKLLPEYLMLWFSRPEFDRYARYKSHGSVREIFDWEEMCRVELPVPPIAEQQKIVNTCNAITARIQLKQKINETLEKTAQCLFDKLFGIYTEKLASLSAKTIFPGLDIVAFDKCTPRVEVGKRPKGGSLKKGFPSLGAECAKGLGCYDNSKAKFISFEYAKQMKKGIVHGYELLVYKDGVGIPNFSIYGEDYPFKEFAINEHVFLIDFGFKESNIFAYFLFKSNYICNELAAFGNKSAIPGINRSDLAKLKLINPKCSAAREFGNKVFPFMRTILHNYNEILKLENFKIFITQSVFTI